MIQTAEIEKVMNDTKEPRNVRDLLKLFGNVDDDEDGVPYIFPDPEENRDEAVPRFYESEERSQFYSRGQREVFMGNDA